MIFTMPFSFGGAAAAATLTTAGLEPLFFATLALVAVAVGLIGRDAWSAASRRPTRGAPRGAPSYLSVAGSSVGTRNRVACSKA